MNMKRVLFVCGGNTCRSPMAKAILEQMLKERGLERKILVDSAAKGIPTHPTASNNARQAIKELYGKDLLANHKPKPINNLNLNNCNLILTMQKHHKNDLPPNKTYTLKEYAGHKQDIDIQDPYGENLQEYRKCRDQIKKCLQLAIKRIIEDC
jgi:protein-tyrosine-phosphatase